MWVAVAVGALLMVAGGAVALVAAPLGGTPAVSLGQAGPFAALLVLGAGLALVAAGTAAWSVRGDMVLAVVAFAASACWMAAELVGSASVAREARSAGLLMAPLLAPLAVHLPVRGILGAAIPGPVRWALGALYVTVAVAAMGHAATYDPFFDVDCAPVCARGDNVLSITIDVPLSRSFTMLGLAATAVGGLFLVGWAAARFVSDRRSVRRQERVVLLPAVLIGVALTWWAVARMMVPTVPSDDEPSVLPALAAAVGLMSVGLGLSASIASEMRRADSLRRLADAIAAGAGSESLRATLARTLDDFLLVVAYPAGGGSSFIDERGEPIGEPRSGGGRVVTAIERGGALIALVEHDAELDPDLLHREIGAAARLAVDNERLEATIRARLRELEASRARIVLAGDAARSRLERDLHDGAQQRLLAVSFELRLAQDALQAGSASAAEIAAVSAATRETDLALAELRELAHGIHPVVLAEDGLSGALATLAEQAPVALEVDGEVGRCGAPTELAAYLVVEEALRRAVDARAARVDVTVGIAEGWLGLRVDAPGLADDKPWTRHEDRVGAAGGRLTVTRQAEAVDTIEVALPCA